MDSHDLVSFVFIFCIEHWFLTSGWMKLPLALTRSDNLGPLCAASCCFLCEVTETSGCRGKHSQLFAFTFPISTFYRRPSRLIARTRQARPRVLLEQRKTAAVLSVCALHVATGPNVFISFFYVWRKQQLLWLFSFSVWSRSFWAVTQFLVFCLSMTTAATG